MNLSSLKPSNGSVKNKKKRIGRGQGSEGGTATRGHKGAQSRSGYSRKLGFEGGQMHYRRIPKFGFKNINRVEYKPVNLKTLQMLVDNKVKKNTVNISTMVENGLVSKNDLVKVLGNGEIKSSLKVEAHGFSKSAKAIEKAG